MIEELEKIRFVTANYPTLKGLNMMVIGFCLFGISLWTGYNPGDLSFPITLMLLSGILIFMLERYHRRVFGRVQSDNRTRRLGVYTSIAFGILGLAAFVLDTTNILPVSTLGIVFAIGLWVDFLRLNRQGTKKYLTYYRWIAILLFITSIIPALGLRNFWELAGFDSPLTGMLTLVGLITFIIGLRVHLFLVQALITPVEVDDGEPI